MPLRPEDLDALPEPARSKLRRALAQIEAVKRTVPASVTADTVPPPSVTTPQKPVAQATRPVVEWQRNGAVKPGTAAAAAKPPQAAAEAPHSLLERLKDWLTEEDPPDPPRRYVPVESEGKVHRFAASVAASPSIPKAAPPPGTPHTASRAPVSGANAREAPSRRRKRHPDGARMERDPWLLPVAVMGVVALIAVGVGAMRHPGSVRAGTRAHAAAQAGASHSQPKASMPSSSAVAAQVTRQTYAPAGQPDCGSIHGSMPMQPVPPPQGSTHPSIPGLCYALGNGESWLVGCATASCDPALHAVISCVSNAGSQQRGVVTEANVVTCAETEAKALTGAGPSG